MVKGENTSTAEQRRSLGYLPKISEGETHNSLDSRDVPAYEGVDMPTVDECRSRAAQGQHADLVEQFHHSHHYRTKHEREQFEDRVRRGSVTQKDIESIHERLSVEKDDRNVLGETDPIDIDIDVTGRFMKSNVKMLKKNANKVKDFSFSLGTREAVFLFL